MKDAWWKGQTRFGVSPGLARIQALLERLGNPHLDYPIVHVAGTNGKGSVSAMVASALRSPGRSVGLYVSPDWGQVNQRVLINGMPIDEDLWDDLAYQIEKAGQGLVEMPTWFETVTALGFLAFSQQHVDIAVIEVGLGGRLDATNVAPASLVSVITPVAFDHRQYLGNTIEAIAGEKAGILKTGTELVLARQPFSSARAVILDRAGRLGVPVWETSREAVTTPQGAELRTPDGITVQVPLLGSYQAGNLDTAWTVVERLASRGLVDRKEAATGIKRVFWPGRFQIVMEAPLVVVDGAHNMHGVQALVDTLKSPEWQNYRWRILFGVLSDKPGDDMVRLLAEVASHFTFTWVPGERGRDPQTLLEAASKVSTRIVADPITALFEERQALLGHEALLVTGSLALVAHLTREAVIMGWPHTLSKPSSGI